MYGHKNICHPTASSPPPTTSPQSTPPQSRRGTPNSVHSVISHPYYKLQRNTQLSTHPPTHSKTPQTSPPVHPFITAHFVRQNPSPSSRAWVPAIAAPRCAADNLAPRSGKKKRRGDGEGGDGVAGFAIW